MGKRSEPGSTTCICLCGTCCLSNACSSPCLFFFPQLGAETGMQSSDLQWMRNFIRLMPLAVLPITIHFPTVGDGLGLAPSLLASCPERLPECLLFSSRQCSCTGSLLQHVFPGPSGLSPYSCCTHCTENSPTC